MRFASLGSGSRGNATLIEADGACLMLDCGFSARETVSRLARFARQGTDITAIIVTHEHADHICGVGVVARQFKLPVWMTPGTFRAAATQLGELPEVRFINPHEAFEINGIQVQPFPVPHDASEPSQFVFTDGVRRLGVLTDVGSGTPHIEQMLSGCDALMLECNHDLDMLMNGPYPPSLKQRVGGQQGHLDNEAAAQILRSMDHSRMQHLVAAHLSEKNNTEYLARLALSEVLGCEMPWVRVADQAKGLPWCRIT